MTANLFVHAERDLVASLGLSQKAVRALRADDLDRSTDWETVAGEVRYSDTGRFKLLSLLKIDVEKIARASMDVTPLVRAREAAVIEAITGTEAPVLEKKYAERGPLNLALVGDRGDTPFLVTIDDEAAAAPLTAATHEDLVCHKQYKPNRRILEAKRSNGEIVLVRVKDNTNLLPGMVMKCRFGAGRVWELAQRLPRKRGRW